MGAHDGNSSSGRCSLTRLRSLESHMPALAARACVSGSLLLHAARVFWPATSSKPNIAGTDVFLHGVERCCCSPRPHAGNQLHTAALPGCAPAAYSAAPGVPASQPVSVSRTHPAAAASQPARHHHHHHSHRKWEQSPALCRPGLSWPAPPLFVTAHCPPAPAAPAVSLPPAHLRAFLPAYPPTCLPRQVHDGSYTPTEQFRRDPESLSSTVSWRDEEDRVIWVYKIQVGLGGGRHGLGAGGRGACWFGAGGKGVGG